MRSKRIVALISVSASVFLLLVLLWTDARASEPNPSMFMATQGQSSSLNDNPRTMDAASKLRLAGNLMPDVGLSNPSSSAQANQSRSNWIDRPGNNLKLGAAILGGVSVLSFVIGGVFMGMGREMADDHTCSTDISGIGCGFAAVGPGIVGISMLGFGAATGAAALGLLIGGEVKSQKADEEAQKRIEMSPYINPIIQKDPSASAGLSLDGAVAGIKGRF